MSEQEPCPLKKILKSYECGDVSIPLVRHAIATCPLKDARDALEEIARYDSSEGYIAMRALPDYDGQKPESLTERMERVVKEHPLSSNYEDDARTIWPKRWAALEGRER